MQDKVVTSKSNIWLRLFMLFSVVLVCVFSIASSMTAFAGDDDEKNYSFYKVASAAAAYYDDASNAAQTEHSFAVDMSLDNMAEAATYLGFIDQDYDTGFFGSTVSFLSSSTQSRGYGSFKSDGMQAYVQYGHALSTLGIDGVANESFDIGAIVRVVAGAMLWLAWGLAAFIQGIFSVVATILQALNPFRWFGSAITSVVSFNGTTTGDAPQWAIGIQRLVASLYNSLQSLGLILTAVIFLAGVGLFLLGWNKTSNMKSLIRKFATRIFFVLFMIPVLGVLYTSALSWMSYESGSALYANRIVGKYLMDFESWAQNSNLALPTGISFSVKVDPDNPSGGTVSTSIPVTQIVSRINGDNTEIYESNASKTANAIRNNFSSMFFTPLLGGVADAIDGDAATKSARDRNAQFSSMSDIIVRYMKSTYYHASDYETAYKAASGIIKSSDKNEKALAESFEKATKISEYQSGNGKIENATYLNVAKPSPTTVSKNGDTYTYTGAAQPSKYNKDSPKFFSFVGTYNYLTTEFSDASVVTYSSHKASSMFVVKSHHSVNIIGNGVGSFLYWLDMICGLVGISVLAIGYAFAMILNSMGRGIRMISSLPFAMLGNLRAMSKVVTYGIMMIIEVIGTLLTYSLLIEIYVNFTDVITSTLTGAFDKHVKAAVVIPGTTADLGAIMGLVGTLVTIVFQIWFISKMLKLRKLIVKTLDEYAAGIIDRLFGAQGAGQSVANAPGVGDKMKAGARKVGGAAAQGAGAYLGAYGTAKALQAVGVAGAGGKGVPGIIGGAGSAEGGAPGEGGADGKTPGEGGDKSANGADNAGGTRTAENAATGAQGFSSHKATVGVDATGTSGTEQGSSGDEAHGRELENANSLADVSTRDVEGSTTPNTGGVEALQTEARDEALKQEQKEGHKKALKGTVKAAAGAVEAGVGAYTGNATMVKDGAQRAASGVSDVSQGSKQAKEARKARSENATNDMLNSARPTGTGQAPSTGGSGTGTTVRGQSSSTVNVSGSSMNVRGGVTNVGVTNKGVSPEQSAQDRAYMAQLQNAAASIKEGKPATVGGRTYTNLADVQKLMNTAQARTKGAKATQAASGTQKAYKATNAASKTGKVSGAVGEVAKTASKVVK